MPTGIPKNGKKRKRRITTEIKKVQRRKLRTPTTLSDDYHRGYRDALFEMILKNK